MFTFCPPGPEERLNVTSQAFFGILLTLNRESQVLASLCSSSVVPSTLPDEVDEWTLFLQEYLRACNKLWLYLTVTGLGRHFILHCDNRTSEMVPIRQAVPAGRLHARPILLLPVTLMKNCSPSSHLPCINIHLFKHERALLARPARSSTIYLQETQHQSAYFHTQKNPSFRLRIHVVLCLRHLLNESITSM